MKKVSTYILCFILFSIACKKEEDKFLDRDPFEDNLDTGLSKLFITRPNKDYINKNAYVDVVVDYISHQPSDGYSFRNIPGQIKGRGNSTWGMPKKPYKLKFNNTTSFFHLPPERRWVLLANYADKTLIRNHLAFWLAKELETPYPPTFNFLEVYLDGKHQGNYMMTDQIEAGLSRVNIASLGPNNNDPNTITGGYLLEIDARAPTKNRPYFMADRFHIKFRAPKQPTPEQTDYIVNYIAEAEEVLYSEDFTHPTKGFRKYFDEESMIKWFIISELFKNVDSKDFSSIFFFKDRGEKIKMGPIWDFDLGAGNAFHCHPCMEPTGWRVKDSYWFGRMYEDPDFKMKVQTIWNESQTTFQQLPAVINEISLKLERSIHQNFILWPHFDSPDWTVAPGMSSHQEHKEYLEDFLSTRLNWMDQEFNQ